jgi:hypothetical protein
MARRGSRSTSRRAGSPELGPHEPPRLGQRSQEFGCAPQPWPRRQRRRGRDGSHLLNQPGIRLAHPNEAGGRVSRRRRHPGRDLEWHQLEFGHRPPVLLVKILKNRKAGKLKDCSHNLNYDSQVLRPIAWNSHTAVSYLQIPRRHRDLHRLRWARMRPARWFRLRVDNGIAAG